MKRTGLSVPEDVCLSLSYGKRRGEKIQELSTRKKKGEKK